MPFDARKNSDRLRLPDFLIIGAQKSGTTTVYRDLAGQPGLFLPAEKEPHRLIDDSVLTESGRSEYASLFAHAPEEAKCGEASTGYTKLPTVTGVPERALRVLGEDLNLIYLMREPVSRAVSHFHHCKATGLEHESVDEALQKSSPYIDYGRYAMQIGEWLKYFPRHRLHTVFFEDYMSNRQERVASLHAFVGAHGEVVQIDSASRYNESASRPVLKGMWRNIIKSKTYHATVQRWVPWLWRRRIQQLLLPRGPAKLEWPSIETVDNLLARFSADKTVLADMIGDLPIAWNPQVVAERFASLRETKQ